MRAKSRLTLLPDKYNPAGSPEVKIWEAGAVSLHECPKTSDYGHASGGELIVIYQRLAKTDAGRFLGKSPTMKPSAERFLDSLMNEVSIDQADLTIGKDLQKISLRSGLRLSWRRAANFYQC